MKTYRLLQAIAFISRYDFNQISILYNGGLSLLATRQVASGSNVCALSKTIVVMVIECKSKKKFNWPNSTSQIKL